VVDEEVEPAAGGVGERVEEVADGDRVRHGGARRGDLGERLRPDRPPPVNLHIHSIIHPQISHSSQFLCQYEEEIVVERR
jgi:hypothetical protein